MNKKLYDALKFVAQILLPASGTLYFALAAIWGLPAAEQVVGTIVAVDTFLGVLLGLSARSYNNSDERFDGTINVIEGPEKKIISLNVDGDPNEIIEKDEVLFRVDAPK